MFGAAIMLVFGLATMPDKTLIKRDMSKQTLRTGSPFDGADLDLLNVLFPLSNLTVACHRCDKIDIIR